jgi:hypothetical protein
MHFETKRITVSCNIPCFLHNKNFTVPVYLPKRYRNIITILDEYDSEHFSRTAQKDFNYFSTM